MIAFFINFITYSFHAEGTVTINKYLNCITNYIIYFTLDKICNRGYIGKSENNLYTRWTGHKSHIKTNLSKCNVAIHEVI